MNPDLLDQVLVALCLPAAGFVVGVGWSAYKAIGWVERMTAWARTCEVPSWDELDGLPLAARPVDALGVE